MRTIILILALLVAAPLAAGTFFRMEVGPPAALGLDKKMKGASFAIRALVCDDLDHVRVTATAESLVNGQRRSVPLTLRASSPGVFAAVLTTEEAHGAVPVDADHDRWLIHLSGTCPASRAQASTLVPMRGTSYVREQVQVLREPATPQQVTSALARLSDR